MNIYRVTLSEEDSTVAYSRTLGLATNYYQAALLALEAEQPEEDYSIEDELQLRVLSVEFVDEVQFSPPATM